MFLRKKKALKKTVTVPIEKQKKPKEEFKKTQQAELQALNISRRDIRKIIKRKDKVKGGAKDIKYTVYEQSAFGKLANTFFENLSLYLTKKIPSFYPQLKNSLKRAGIPIMSSTYVSIILFSSTLAFIGILIGAFIALSMTSGFTLQNIAVSFVKAIGLAVVAFIVTALITYIYPNIVISSRKKAIKNDLPFLIIHMAAVAGSGAQPISLFNLVLDSGEYKGLEKEIKKIVNYVNLFGYDLTSALRAVAKTTPSVEFRELLTGIVSTLETGGDLKLYLNSKAEDALTTYKLDRKRYVESLQTYSDIYTSVLIAAPLLFIVTLAIINLLGGKVGPFDAKTLAMFGTFAAIPFLNIGFFIFLNLVQPGE